MWDRAGQLGESGKYRTRRLRVICFYIQSFEGGNPRLCRLMTDHLAPVNNIDYILHIHDLWGPANLVASTVAELDDTLHRFMDVHWDSVRATHRLPVEVFVWKTTLGWGRTRPDSLIVIVKGGHSWCLCGSRVSCCHVISLARRLLIRISVTPSDMGEAYSLLSFYRSVISSCSHETYDYV
jgi:hypothetical protein